MIQVRGKDPKTIEIFKILLIYFIISINMIFLIFINQLYYVFRMQLHLLTLQLYCITSVYFCSFISFTYSVRNLTK